MGFLGVTTLPELLSALLFFPMAIYFLTQVMPEPREKRAPVPEAVELRLEKDEPKLNISDHNKRAFIKLIGSAGISMFIFTILARKDASAAFFGSGGGPGIVGVKNSQGTLIDPSKHHPTDGYRINQSDETSDPPYAYYGFTNKDGAWFIMRETTSGVDEGQYRYRRGDDDFPTGWGARTTNPTSYDYFDNITWPY